MEIAALERNWHPGRFHAGIGHGVGGTGCGRSAPSPASELRLLAETVGAVRGLLSPARTVSVEGRYVRLRGRCERARA